VEKASPEAREPEKPIRARSWAGSRAGSRAGRRKEKEEQGNSGFVVVRVVRYQLTV